MKVLWFEVTVPSRYKSDGIPVGGWQDSLEDIVRQCNNIELSIAFEGMTGMTAKNIDGVSYIPLTPRYSIVAKLKRKYNRWIKAEKIVPLALKVIDDVKPDIIHVFGLEWEYGQVAKYTQIPVVIHMQGCLMAYKNFSYPPGFSIADDELRAGLNLKRQIGIRMRSHLRISSLKLEKSNFKAVKYYMGRTDWDHHLVGLFHPGSKYFYCSEALRPVFYKSINVWKPHTINKCCRMLTVGTSGYLKGLDVILKTAHILKEQNFDFEWNIAGGLGMKKIIEKEIGLKFEDNNIRFLGFRSADQVIQLMMNSDLFIHASYIDNSPNAVCEAQYMGMPIIATNVGGISSLIKTEKEGILVPANHPYEMAFCIIHLFKDKEMQKAFSTETRKRARERHNPQVILKDLLNCYKSLINEKKPL